MAMRLQVAGLLAAAAAVSQAATLTVDVSGGSFNILVDGALWYSAAAAPAICVAGTNAALQFTGSVPAAGTDAFGAWAGVNLSFAFDGSSSPVLVQTFKSYPALQSVATVTTSFPNGVNTSNCGSNSALSTASPAFSTTSGLAPSLYTLSISGEALANTRLAVGVEALAPSGLDMGPVISYDASSGLSLVVSTLDNHKIVLQDTQQPQGAAAIAALWSEERQDQVACLSAVCYSDQGPQSGKYVQQRIEGYGVSAGQDGKEGRKGRLPAAVYVDGVRYATAPLSFAYSAEKQDNWIGTNSTPPDSSYGFHGANGAIIAAPPSGTPPPPGTLPLLAYSRVYNASHTDWAAVASADGIAWAEAGGYTRQYVIGYVWTQPPSLRLRPASSSADGGGQGQELEVVSGGGGAAAAVPAASAGNVSTTWAWGVSAAIPSLPAGWSYSLLLVAADGGPTAAAYTWGAALQRYHNTSRLPSVTLSDLGYYTDDGAYYYVWSHWLPQPRPAPAEELLLSVVDDLAARGVRAAYMQLDDWWYQGRFFFGNVLTVVNWTANPSAELFPSGLPTFAQRLGLPLQLYTPFWDDKYATPYRMTESTVFKGTKLVVPEDSYHFFRDLFALGDQQTGGRFSAYEIDFLLSNFAGSASMFETVGSADQWYRGMADAALERGIAIQYCLPSVTDILESLSLPAVVQARASPDYVNTETNPFALGGSSLWMGALAIAPSKDTLWTSSPQPPTSSDAIHWNYTTQPHVRLDAVLATLSLGPVGISDGLGQVDAGLIGQAVLAPNSSTLLRPSRPLSWVDSVFLNGTVAGGTVQQDVRGTHAAVPATAPSSVGGGARSTAATNASSTVSHLVVAWRTTADVTLQPMDLYPPPAAGAAARLAVRPHIIAPAGAAQYAGCVDGTPASPSCVTILPPGVGAVIPAVGTALANFSLTAIYEQQPNGAYFLGELDKFVHVSPQRFAYVLAGQAAASALASGAVSAAPGPAGIVAGVRGLAGQQLTLVAVDPQGITRVVTTVLPASGYADVGL